MEFLKSYNRRGLIGYWKYHGNVSALGTWYDISGNGNNGTLVGNSYINNNGLICDGNGDYAGISNNASFAFANNSYSICIWLKSLGFPGTYGIPLSKVSTSSPFPGVYIECTTSYISAYSDNNTQLSYNYNLASDGLYHMLSFSRDTSTGNSVRKLFLDGIEVANDTVTLYSDTTTTQLNIGCHIQSYYFWYGAIDDAMIFNRLLSLEEIKQLYYQTKGEH